MLRIFQIELKYNHNAPIELQRIVYLLREMALKHYDATDLDYQV